MPSERDNKSENPYESSRIEGFNNHLCPYCGQEMEAGAMLGARWPPKWQPADRKWLGGHFVGEFAFIGRPKAHGYRCAACKKIIIDDQ